MYKPRTASNRQSYGLDGYSKRGGPPTEAVSATLYGATVPATAASIALDFSTLTASLFPGSGVASASGTLIVNGTSYSVMFVNSYDATFYNVIVGAVSTPIFGVAATYADFLNLFHTNLASAVNTVSVPAIVDPNQQIVTNAVGATANLQWIDTDSGIANASANGADISGYLSQAILKTWSGSTYKFADSYSRKCITASGVSAWTGTLTVVAYTNGAWTPVCSGPAAVVANGTYSFNELGALTGWTLDKTIFNAGIAMDDLWCNFVATSDWNTQFLGGSIAIGPFNITP